jgi:alkylation response protein AidB-like acyl-CoA dehydrogenase
MANPLLSDRDVDFQLYEVHGAADLARMAPFADYTREAVGMLLDSVKRLARETLFPAYRAMDQEPARYEGGRMRVHPKVPELYRKMCELGLLQTSTLPSTVYSVAAMYIQAANTTAYSWMGLTSGAAHLIEKFGSADLHKRFMEPMYSGRFTGTMALTEPQAGSSLSDVKTRATPLADGSGAYRIQGSKIFISGGDNDFSENIVHLTLARIDGAPAGTKGISLFAIPRLREENGALVDNDVACAGAIHKLGARGIPSCMLELGERGDCHGWLVGGEHRGLPHMFQMMNEARILVGASATASASAAYLESLSYARERTQGRPANERDPNKAPIPIIEHADVRRMLLRQKAIVEGSMSLIIAVSKLSDLAVHDADEGVRARSDLLLDLLTPVAKTFPSEKGFESNALALQVHGGYGYSSEYLVEAWLRDQKLNTLHEGTSGIQSLDLLGRKVMARGGEAMRVFDEELRGVVAKARAAQVPEAWCAALEKAWDDVTATTMELGARGMGGDVDGMLRHSSDYLDMFGTLVIAWQWLLQASVAAPHAHDDQGGAFYEGKMRATQYWINTELPRVHLLATLCRDNEDSYASMRGAAFG